MPSRARASMADAYVSVDDILQKNRLRFFFIFFCKSDGGWAFMDGERRKNRTHAPKKTGKLKK
jgi:hypothetical protein